MSNFDYDRMQEWGNVEIYSYFGFFQSNNDHMTLIPFAPFRVGFDRDKYRKLTFGSKDEFTMIEFGLKPV